MSHMISKTPKQYLCKMLVQMATATGVQVGKEVR